jgi:hypothetical protein
MDLATAASTALLGMFLWITTFLLPRAIRERNAFGITSVLLTALTALVLWLLLAAGVRSHHSVRTESAIQSGRAAVL